MEPSHVIPAPELPISSFKLAQALNPKTEPLKLTRFSQDEDPYVRKAVCRNPSLPKAELEKLTKDINSEFVVIGGGYSGLFHKTCSEKSFVI